MEMAISKEEAKAYDRGIYATFLGAFLVLFQIGIYFVYIPWNAERLQITEAEIGIGLFAFGLLNLIGNQTSGRLIVPRIGTKNSIVIGLLGIAYCPLILNLAPSYQWFLIAFMPFGFFVGLFSPSSQSQISMIESKTSRVLTPLYHAAFSFGSLVGAFSAFFTIRYVDSPILIFSITGTALIVGALLINKFGLDKSFENLEKTPKFKLPKNSILVFGILMMLNYATMGIILDWSALWLTKDLLVPLYLGGAIIFAFNIGEISARLIASKMIKKALYSHFARFWMDSIQEVRVGNDGRDTNKLRLYKTFKGSFHSEPYINLVQNRNQRSSLSRLRISAHHLGIEVGRWSGIPANRRYCNYCQYSGTSTVSVDDEIHFLSDCPTFLLLPVIGTRRPIFIFSSDTANVKNN